MKITEDPVEGEHVIVDGSTAVIPQWVQTCVLTHGGVQLVGLELEGPRVGGDLANRSDELYIVDARTAAAVCEHLIRTFAALADVPGMEPVALEFARHLDAALAELSGGGA